MKAIETPINIVAIVIKVLYLFSFNLNNTGIFLKGVFRGKLHNLLEYMVKGQSDTTSQDNTTNI